MKLDQIIRLKSSILVLLILTSIGSLSAQSNLKETYIAKLLAFSQQTQSIKSDYIQTQYLALLIEPQKSSGVFYYSKPNKLRWEQMLPTSYILIFNENDFIKIVDNVRNHNSAGNMQTEAFRKFILGVINGSIFESKDFDSFFERQGAFIKIDLVPKQKNVKTIFDKISLKFDESSILLMELTFLEKNGDSRKIEFTHHQLDLKNLNQQFE